MKHPAHISQTCAPGPVACVSAGLVSLAIAAAVLVLFAGNKSVSHSLATLFEDDEGVRTTSDSALSPPPPTRRPEVSLAARGRSAVIIQVDSRPLTSDISDETQYHSLTAAINYQYASAHGYECA
jgi:hypothetical protein